MPTWAWILIAAGVVLIVVLAFMAWRRGRNRQVEQHRAEASVLRSSAEERYAEAGRREAAAEQEALRARRAREAADDAIRRADEVDPDIESDDVDSEDVEAEARR